MVLIIGAGRKLATYTTSIICVEIYVLQSAYIMENQTKTYLHNIINVSNLSKD